jgi:pimeloyl-ACP methyl ester carboxylesterase
MSAAYEALFLRAREGVGTPQMIDTGGYQSGGWHLTPSSFGVIMHRRTSAPLISCALVVVLLGLLGPGIGRAAAARAIPTLVRSACVVSLPSDERIDCYLLTVPENRTRDGSNMIHLPVIVFRSRGASPRPDPVIFTAGGPGASSLGAFSSGKTIRLLEERDFIVFEQRGTKYAQPSLDCAEVDVEHESSFLSGLGVHADEAKELDAARACFHRLTSSGIDLAGYNNAEIAEDMIDLRQLLGIKSWNLYGLSYSTWLMMDVMRMDPRGVRSALLESVEPPDVPYDEMGNANLQRSLDVLFDACATDLECSRSYPDLRSSFAQMVRSLDSRPIDIIVKDASDGNHVRPFTGRNAVDTIYSELNNAATIPHLPQAIYSASKGSYTALTALAQDGLSPDSLSWGMRYSVWCADGLPLDNPTIVDQQTHNAYPLFDGEISAAFNPAICSFWKVPAAAASEWLPLTSSIPTIIFAGEYDPNTPPSWGRRALRTLNHAYLYEFPGYSHTPSRSACAREMTIAFFDDPTKAPDTTCFARIKERQFTP